MIMSRKRVNTHPRESCYFCESEGPIETHHINPRRYGGSDEDHNLVDLCSNCHNKLEALYNDKTIEKIKNSSNSCSDKNDQSQTGTTSPQVDPSEQILLKEFPLDRYSGDTHPYHAATIHEDCWTAIVDVFDNGVNEYGIHEYEDPKKPAELIDGILEYQAVNTEDAVIETIIGAILSNKLHITTDTHRVGINKRTI